ncbi:MAG: hypothetical protein WB511_12710 [Nitrososphaeraceae archaeon]
MPREISSIKPEIRKIGNKKFIACRTTVKEREEIKFYYSSEEYDTFENEGFNPPPNNERFDRIERES